jgi:hypothetical protein
MAPFFKGRIPQKCRKNEWDFREKDNQSILHSFKTRRQEAGDAAGV